MTQIQITDISCIVIARNEAFGIERSLAALTAMPLRDCQIVCVDSNSSDETRAIMERYAQQYPELVEVYGCSGYTNAAIARNVGMAHARKAILLFLDGDVEPNAPFLTAATEMIRSGRAAMVCGSLREIRYAPGFRTVIEEVSARLPVREERHIYFSGGIFMVAAEVARQVGMWDEGLIINEDFDYTLRISRLSRCMVLPLSMGTHHTLAENYTARAWQHLLQGYPMFYGEVLRRHWMTNFPGVVSLLSREAVGKSGGFFLMLLAGGLATAFSFSTPWWWGGLPALAFFFVDMTRSARSGRNLLSRLIINYAYAPLVVAGLLIRPRRRT